MKRLNSTRCIAAAMLMILGAALTAQAQTVTFSRIDDAVPSRWVDPATTRPNPLDRNKLIIGFNKGLDSTTFKYREFRASTAAFSYPTAMDTISVRISAPTGYYVAKVTYTQRGTGSVVRTGRAYGGATWIVADQAASLGTFTTNPSLTKTIDLTSRKLTVLPVSITNSLNAFATTLLGSATVHVTSAEIRVQLLRR
jgi:acyl-coenzyme A thioesterase PaaI-like protein